MLLHIVKIQKCNNQEIQWNSKDNSVKCLGTRHLEKITQKPQINKKLNQGYLHKEESLLPFIKSQLNTIS